MENNIKFKIVLEASEDKASFRLDLSDLGLTKEEWSKLSPTEQDAAIQKAVDETPSQPYWQLAGWTEID
jgi:hypothetical protein